MDLALFADALTFLRGILGLVLAYLIARGRMEAVAVLLAAGWLTDFFDGRVARMAGTPTHLGGWDFPADVALGAGVLVGLAAGGLLPPVLVVVVLVVCGGGYLLLRNAALGMALQAVAWAGVLWRMWTRRVQAGWLPVVVAAGIGIVHRRKLVHDEIPMFLHGVANAVRLRRGTTFGLDGRDPRPPR